ncbi:heme lyase CcmF/NrfE family subunit [Desulfobaculum bizertense]|uniref:Cytochrome c-type biogenesis protein CcmF n=1 Tax=Desulfobaculum bizertense DSM 18034 TaxID=1121442 RepID=A0A1T4VL01_9BACT|nr:cytochrome c-type biogenesis CcmF C-terminal domain-containing protein [Desulfobaculum bizertense]UIJ38097.1 cytochrome c biogenesis protein CcsA [Desulfobaculum bizertense]SKA65548.1 cytochrome c-type biogenesis protein CcmF [Desulfobaculum bizertense DSM 18034]
MHLFAYFCLLAALFVSLLFGGLSLYMLWTGRTRYAHWTERGQLACFALVMASSVVLLRALVAKDFSLQYVWQYTDSYLPLFYTVTAFWAGQAGSMLFWALCIVTCGLFFAASKHYAKLQPNTRVWFWLFHYSVQAFFLYILSGPSNPFLEFAHAPVEGNGLNPLLQNPGMIFHPPLLFIGYAGFTVPCCLALASWVNKENVDWLPVGRLWTVFAWLFLTAGIILGAWWSYMELGWGGYWAWDPVENSSLIPWLAATAFLHTAIIQRRRGSLPRINVFFITLTFFLCIFATYVVRSGVIDSLHAFGRSELGEPLVFFMLGTLIAGVLVVLSHKDKNARPLDELLSRSGLLFLAAWFFLAIGLVIFLGTMWPLISSMWNPKPIGLEPAFYNRVCLPLFACISLFLVFCPWLGWKGGVVNRKAFYAVCGSIIPAAGLMWMRGIHHPVALLGAVSAVVGLFGIVVLFASRKDMLRNPHSWAAYGVHVGLLLMTLAVAFSGPYKIEREAVLHPGESMQIAEYTVKYEGMQERRTPGMDYVEARLTVTENGKKVGTMTPQRRAYRNNRNVFAEVSVIPGLGDELYSTLVGSSPDGQVSLRISVNPLVNWLWIGGVLMTLFPLLAFWRRKA